MCKMMKIHNAPPHCGLFQKHRVWTRPTSPTNPKAPALPSQMTAHDTPDLLHALPRQHGAVPRLEVHLPPGPPTEERLAAHLEDVLPAGRGRLAGGPREGPGPTSDNFALP